MRLDAREKGILVRDHRAGATVAELSLRYALDEDTVREAVGLGYPVCKLCGQGPRGGNSRLKLCKPCWLMLRAKKHRDRLGVDRHGNPTPTETET